MAEARNCGVLKTLPAPSGRPVCARTLTAASDSLRKMTTVHGSNQALIVALVLGCAGFVSSRCCNAEDREVQQLAATCPGGVQVQYWECCGRSGSCNVFCCNCDDECHGGNETSPGGLLLHLLKNGLENAGEYTGLLSLLSGLGRRRRDVTAQNSIVSDVEKTAEERLNTLEHFVKADKNKDGVIDQNEAYETWCKEMKSNPLSKDIIPGWFSDVFVKLDLNKDNVLIPSEFDKDLKPYDPQD